MIWMKELNLHEIWFSNCTEVSIYVRHTKAHWRVWYGHMQAMTSPTMGIDWINHKHSLSPHATRGGSSSRLLGLSPPGRKSASNSNIINYVWKSKRFSWFEVQHLQARNPLESCSHPQNLHQPKNSLKAVYSTPVTIHINLRTPTQVRRIFNCWICLKLLLLIASAQKKTLHSFSSQCLDWCRNINFTPPTWNISAFRHFIMFHPWQVRTRARLWQRWAKGVFFQRRLWMFHDICYNVRLGEWEMWQNLTDIHIFSWVIHQTVVHECSWWHCFVGPAKSTVKLTVLSLDSTDRLGLRGAGNCWNILKLKTTLQWCRGGLAPRAKNRIVVRWCLSQATKRLLIETNFHQFL